IQTMDLTESKEPTPPGWYPATITAAVPRVGTRAALPGQGVVAPKPRPAYATARMPTQPRTWAARTGTRGQREAPRATAAPMASSQSRVVVTKKAAGSPLAVIRTDQRKDGSAMSARARAITGRTRPGRARRSTR